MNNQTIQQYSVTPKAEFTDGNFATIDSYIDIEIANIRRVFSHCLTKGFQATIQIETDEKGLEYDKGIKFGTKGSFAQCKLNTLRRFPQLNATGDHSIEELIRMIREVSSTYDVSELAKLSSTQEITRAQQEKLREIGLTAYLGGIRVPFVRFRYNEHPTAGRALITFSALTPEQDLCMCLIILEGVKRALMSGESGVYYFETLALEQLPTVGFYATQYLL